jgi:hypothetical protein
MILSGHCALAPLSPLRSRFPFGSSRISFQGAYSVEGQSSSDAGLDQACLGRNVTRASMASHYVLQWWWWQELWIDATAPNVKLRVSEMIGLVSIGLVSVVMKMSSWGHDTAFACGANLLLIRIRRHKAVNRYKQLLAYRGACSKEAHDAPTLRLTKQLCA